MEQLLFKVKLAERAERFEEMTELVKKIVAKSGPNEVSSDVRNLVSVAYKNRVSEIRTSWRLLSQIEQKEQAKGLVHGAACVKQYREEIEDQIIRKCDEAIELATQMLGKCSDNQATTFLLRMKADYNRYIAELSTPRKTAAIEGARRFYEEALKTGLSPKHHVMLGVSLNKAIFYYEVLDKKSEAIEILQGLVTQSDLPSDGNKRNLSIMMNLIDDNLRFWQAK